MRSHKEMKSHSKQIYFFRNIFFFSFFDYEINLIHFIIERIEGKLKTIKLLELNNKLEFKQTSEA